MKFSTLRDEFYHADGCTDMTKLVVAFCNFAKVPEKERSHRLIKEIYLLQLYVLQI